MSHPRTDCVMFEMSVCLSVSPTATDDSVPCTGPWSSSSTRVS